jgi:hypothetical protein
MLMLLSFGCRKEAKLDTLAVSKSNIKEIVSFVFRSADNPSLLLDLPSVIINDTIFLPQTSDSTNRLFKPTITVSDDAMILERIDTIMDFNHEVTFTIMAHDSSTRKYVTSWQKVPAPRLSGFKINGVPVAYDSVNNTYYFPGSLTTPVTAFKATFDTMQAPKLLFDGMFLGFDSLNNISLPVNNTITIAAATVTGQTGAAARLVITGLPIVQLSTTTTIGDDEINAGVSLIDPDSATHGGKYFISSDCTIKLRGATSRYNPKRPYGLKMKDSNGKNTDIPVMGMRGDQSWILDAMYIDKSRMANRLCTDLWNSYNNVPYITSEPDAFNGTHGYFVEVFLNREYIGVYCMTEKLDRKQIKAKKSGGFVYKADDWTNATLLNGADLMYDNSVDTWNGWESQYPDAKDDVAMDWAPLYNLVNFIGTSSDTDFISNISSHVYLDNIADYLILLNIMGGTDNVGKNTFLSVYNVNKGQQFFYSPWDMDNTMGFMMGELYTPTNIFLGEDNKLLSRLLELDPGGFRGMVKARWNALKTDQLSKATVNKRMETYRDLLVNTNAIERESARWGTVDVSSTVAAMQNWYGEHYDFLDNIFSNY